MPKNTSSSRKKNMRQELRDLDIEISFLEGVLRRDPEYEEALVVLGDDYTRRGRFEDGLKIDLALVKLRPEDALVHYNLACSYSLTNQFEAAATSLDMAIDLGYRDFSFLAHDPDLKPFRGTEFYKKIQDKVKQLKM